MSHIFMTDKGKVRQHNEDSGAVIRNKSGQRLAIVADGMGGHRAGDVASSLTVEQLVAKWKDIVIIDKADEAESWLKTSILEVNRYVFDYQATHSECEGMGTTIIAAIATENFLTIAHVGDSRCYLYNDEGFKQITEDHSLVNELVRMGQISKEDAEHHPRKNVVLRALGTDKNLDIDIMTLIFEQDDKLLICSDGLSNKVSDQEMKDIIESEFTLEKKATSLIDQANLNGGEDNISVCLLEHEDSHQAGENV